MTHSLRRFIYFAMISIGGLGLLVVLLALLSQTPRPISKSPSPTVTPTPPLDELYDNIPSAATDSTPRIVALVDDEPIVFERWQQAVALDHAMSALVGQVAPGPEETLSRLINERLVLRAAMTAGILEADQFQSEAWLAGFVANQSLDEATLVQALIDVDLSRADLVEEIVPRLLQVQQALVELSPDGDGEAWVAGLRRQARVEATVSLEMLEHLSAPVLPTMVPQASPQPTSPALSLSSGPRVGEQALDFSLEATDAAIVRLSDLRGRPVVLSFWATWCMPCRQELSLLQTVHERDLIVLGIAVRETPDQVTAIAADFDLELVFLLDPDGQVSDAYHVRGLPTSLFINRTGTVVARHVGPLDQAALNGYLDLLLVTP